ncbi:hypothetical protein ACFL6H_02790 [Candidatus Latescibacterota bacterium]
MAPNSINRYYKNNTVKENDPYGFGKFTKTNIQRGQQLSSVSSDTAVRKPANTATENDTFNRSANTPMQTANMLKRGIDVYKRNSRDMRGTAVRATGINVSGGQTGSLALRTTSIAGNSKNTALSNLSARRNKTNVRRALDVYRNTADFNKTKSGPRSKGTGLLSGSVSKPLSGGLMSAAKLSVPMNANNGNAFMKQGISQYKSIDSNKQKKNNVLKEDAETLPASEPKTPEKQETL